MTKVARLLAFAVAFLALESVGASPASAELRDRSWEFGTYLSGGFFDNDSNIENTAGVGIRVGYFFLKNHALELSVDDILTDVKSDSDLNANLFTVKIGYLYTFMPLARVTPHLFLGAGAQNLTVYENFCDDNDWWDNNNWCTDTLVDETDPVAYAGIGMRVSFTHSMSMRADYQGVAVWPDEGDQNVLIDQIVNVGVSWVFGGGR